MEVKFTNSLFFSVSVGHFFDSPLFQVPLQPPLERLRLRLFRVMISGSDGLGMLWFFGFSVGSCENHRKDVIKRMSCRILPSRNSAWAETGIEIWTTPLATSWHRACLIREIYGVYGYISVSGDTCIFLYTYLGKL